MLELTSLCNRPGENRPATGYFSLPGGMSTSLDPGDDTKKKVPGQFHFSLEKNLLFQVSHTPVAEKKITNLSPNSFFFSVITLKRFQ